MVQTSNEFNTRHAKYYFSAISGLHVVLPTIFQGPYVFLNYIGLRQRADNRKRILGAF